MTRETIVETDFGVMYYYPEKKIVHHVIHKYQFGEPLREFLTAGTETISARGATKWLSDDRSYAALTKEDIAWGRETFGPTTVKAGWTHWAIVLPEKVVGKMAMERVIAMYSELGLTVQVFTDPDEGLAWLEGL